MTSRSCRSYNRCSAYRRHRVSKPDLENVQCGWPKTPLSPPILSIALRKSHAICTCVETGCSPPVHFSSSSSGSPHDRFAKICLERVRNRMSQRVASPDMLMRRKLKLEQTLGANGLSHETERSRSIVQTEPLLALDEPRARETAGSN